MNRKERTRLKRKYKRNLWLAFSCLITFVIVFIGILVFNVPQPLRIMAGITIIMGVFAGLIFNILADWTHRDLLKFKKDVREYRTRRFYLQCMDLIQEGKLSEARDIYNDFIPAKHPTKDYLYSLLVYLFSKSDDPILKEQGESRIKLLRDFYDPNKVF